MLIYYYRLMVLILLSLYASAVRDKILFYIYSASIIIAIYLFIQYKWDIQVFQWKHGLSSTIGNQNFVAETLFLVLPISVYYIWRSKTKASKIFHIFVALLILTGIIVTEARGVYVGAVVSLLVFLLAIILSGIKRLFSYKNLIIIIAAIILVISASSFIFQDLISKQLQSVLVLFHGGFEVRIPIWESTMQIVQTHPLIGAGTGQFKIVYPFYRGVSERTFSGIALVHHTHCEYFQIMSELGLIGLGLFLWLIVLSFYGGIKNIFTRLDKNTAVTGALSLGVIGLLISAMFSFPFQLPVSWVWFMTFLYLMPLYGKSTPPRTIDIKLSSIVPRFCVIAIIFLSYVSAFYSDIYTRAGRTYQNSGAYPQTIYCFERSTETNPGKYLDLYGIGESFLKMNPPSDITKEDLYDSALPYLNTSLSLDPYNATYHNNTAAAYFYLKKYPEAATEYRKALYLYPDYRDARDNLVSVYINQGALFLEQGKLNDAIISYMRALNINPDNKNGYYNIGYILGLEKKYKESLPYFEKAYRLDNSFKEAYEKILWLKERLGSPR